MTLFSDAQFDKLLARLDGLDRALAKLSADNAALKAQLGELHGRMSQTLDEVDLLNKRISMERRPKV